MSFTVSNKLNNWPGKMIFEKDYRVIAAEVRAIEEKVLELQGSPSAESLMHERLNTINREKDALVEQVLTLQEKIKKLKELLMEAL